MRCRVPFRSEEINNILYALIAVGLIVLDTDVKWTTKSPTFSVILEMFGNCLFDIYV